MKSHNYSNKVNPLTVFILLLINTIILIIGNVETYWLSITLNFILLILMNYKKVIPFGIAFVFFKVALEIIYSYFEISGWIGSIYTINLIILKLFPIWILSAILMNYNTSEIINSLRKIKIPNYLCVSTGIFLRFLPEYTQYLKEVREGMKVRGLKNSILRPIQTFERFIVPMIYKAFETSETLSCALITKGIDCECKKTSYHNLNMTLLDYIFMFCELGIVGIAIWKK